MTSELQLSTVAVTAPDFERLIELALATCPSPETRRMYGVQLRKFIRSGLPLNRDGVSLFMQAQRDAGWGSATEVSANSALRKLATEANIRGLMTDNELRQILSIKPQRQFRSRAGNWLTIEQTQEFLMLPDRQDFYGQRDAAVLACMLGCGLRRAEMSGLRWSHYQMRDGRACFVDVLGKGRKLRTVPIPQWAVCDIDAWKWMQVNVKQRVTGLTGYLPKPDHSRIAGGLKPDSIHRIVEDYGHLMGLELTPHDLRRSLAQLLRKAGAPLEQIQYTLGHESVTTTMAYLGSKLILERGQASVDGIAIASPVPQDRSQMQPGAPDA